DYLTKPFNPRELTIRARNLLSRTTSSTEDDDLPSRVSFNGWTLDGDSRSLIAPSGNEFRLPRSEFRALHLFLSNPGKILTREQLIMEMTGRELRPNDRTVDVTIRRIRKHFESEPNEEELIVTIHGEGYRFCGSVDS
ncbi:MAG TPA: two-component system response regulator ArcA, partial [Alteromonas sp.]|nr:two-component system response regulator ArcA [Alteromonas sp.]